MKDEFNKRRRAPLANSFDQGKLPPQAIEFEEAVLGALMLDKNCVLPISEILKPDSFYKEAHQMIFRAIFNLFNKNAPIDILTVTNELKRTEELEIIGGPYFITQLTNRIASAANVEYHARIVAQKALQREMIRLSMETINEAYEDSADVFTLMDGHEKKLTAISNMVRPNSSRTILQLLGEVMKRNDQMLNAGGITGIPSGFIDLDKKTGGWQNSDLIVIAARPGMGKTAFMLQLARNAAVRKKPSGVISLEMSSLQLTQRLFAQETNINSHVVMRFGVTPAKMSEIQPMISNLADAPLFIDDTPGLTIFEIKAIARRWKREHGLEILFLDYLQLAEADIDTTNGNARVEVISRGLKGLAKELDIPIIALSQLSRAVEMRGGEKIPQLSDLRESGAIEQDADGVIFLYRPEYYGITQGSNGENLQGLAKAIIAKFRNGQPGDVSLKWDGPTMKYFDFNQPAQTAINPNQAFESEKNEDDKPF